MALMATNLNPAIVVPALAQLLRQESRSPMAIDPRAFSSSADATG